MTTKKNVNRVDYNDVAVCDDWKLRLKREYVELKEKYEKIRKYNIKEETRTQLEAEPGIRRFADRQRNKDDIRNRIMNAQEEIMCSYLRLLEERMTLEGIDY